MVMGYIWFGFLLVSFVFALLGGNTAALSAAVANGAQAGVTLTLSLAGSVCLWSGVGKLMQQLGVTRVLTRLLSAPLFCLFPEARSDAALADALSANVCANLLGLGNAATPMGIRAATRLTDPARPEVATDALCRLVVLNTASIQLIPTNVAAVRASLGCASPFDILPAVWLSSFLAAGGGLLAAVLLGKLWKHG